MGQIGDIQVEFDDRGLLPCVVQDWRTGEVLTLAWMNAEAYAETVRTGRAVYYSRSRGRLWHKGEESGHVQSVQAIYVDCDADAILLKVEQVGAACHEGYRSCFFRQVTPSGLEVVIRFHRVRALDAGLPASSSAKATGPESKGNEENLLKREA